MCTPRILVNVVNFLLHKTRRVFFLAQYLLHIKRTRSASCLWSGVWFGLVVCCGLICFVSVLLRVLCRKEHKRMAPRNSEVWQVDCPEIKMRSAHLFKTREWTDCTFQFESDTSASQDSLHAHKLILSMASPVFAAMFYGDFGDKESPVKISDIDLHTFSSLLEYIYTEEVNLSDAQLAISLFAAANKYILVHLEKKCLDYLIQKVDCNNVCEIYEFSCLYSEKLKTKCLQLISTKTVDVLKNPNFRNISAEALGDIVSMETLNISSEMELFNAVVDYLDNIDEKKLATKLDECKTNLVDDKQIPENASCSCAEEPNEPVAKKRRLARKYLPGIVEKIRFLTMTPTDLAESSDVATVLTKDEMFALLANSASTKVDIPMPEGFSTSREDRHPEYKWKSMRLRRLKGLSGNENGEGCDEMLQPTDEEIMECVKQILHEANLEQITMKTVCEQVYSRYPEYDLRHRKDFIKQCVKRLI